MSQKNKLIRIVRKFVRICALDVALFPSRAWDRDVTQHCCVLCNCGLLWEREMGSRWPQVSLSRLLGLFRGNMTPEQFALRPGTTKTKALYIRWFLLVLVVRCGRCC